MKKMIGCAGLLCVISTSYAVDLGLDADCNGNGIAKSSPRANYDIQCILPSSIDVSGIITLAKTNAHDQKLFWALNDVVTVGNGHLKSTTYATATDVMLKIESGTEVVGLTEDSTLVITRGAKIDAVGTVQDPIIFSSADEDYQNSGEWGGVIISGFATTPDCYERTNCTINQISSRSRSYYYGGTGSAAENDASSGRIRNVVVTEGRIADPTDVNLDGFYLYSVSSKSSITNIHVDDITDDDREYFFSGTTGVANKYLGYVRE